MKARILLLAALLASFGVFAQTLDSERIALAIEALSRLNKAQIAANPKLTAALDRVLEATRGTPQFVELVRKFEVAGKSEALIETAVLAADASVGADALRIVLDAGELDRIRGTILGTNISHAIKIVEALGNLGEKRTLELIFPIVEDTFRALALRKRAVSALTRTQEGASALLQIAKTDRLSADLKLIAAQELHQARWPEIKREAEIVLPAPQARDDQPLPPIAELAKRSGDPAKGAEIFSRPEVGCINCHQVHGNGIDFGPKLSEIGTKLGKDALYEAIINPSAGISFDYEAWEITLKNGDEAFGLIISETADEVTVKAQAGVRTRYKKADIESRRKMSASIMPSGLQQTLSVEDFVSLVEYLASLKSAKPAGN
ncbi:MAG: c-type cytochrome [Verrucomicrobia bacterium]|nr:c-type cytochrome [Verrucomicrobiota bacterium]